MDKIIKKTLIFKIKNVIEQFYDRFSNYNEYVESYFNWLKDEITKPDFIKTNEFNREDLEWFFEKTIDQYDSYIAKESMYEEELSLDDIKDVYDFCLENIIKPLLPNWKDTSSNYVNLGKLIEHYDLDLDNLYFDKDSSSIRDNEGNIWAD